MNIVRKLLRLARALDWAKDPDPDHWKTINGAKVHLDADGNYDGGAGGRFNGKHHYGPGYKEKQNTPKRRPASEIVLGARKPNVKGLSESALRERMKKANNYGDWNRAQGEIYRRLRQKERDLKMQFNAAYGKPKQKEIGEVLRKHQALLEQFRQEAKIPYKFIEESFNNDPEAARKAYEGKQFWNSAFYPAYEKWKAKKERTPSIMQNLANSLKNQEKPAPQKVSKSKGTISDRFINFINHQIGIDLSKYRDKKYERRGRVNILIDKMPRNEKVELQRFANKHPEYFTILENGGLGVVLVPNKNGGWENKATEKIG